MNWSDKYNVLEYSFVLPHDMETLIDFMGGADTFESRLDMMVLTQMTTLGLGVQLTISSLSRTCQSRTLGQMGQVLRQS